MGLRTHSLFTKLGHLTSKISFLIVQTERKQSESYLKAFCNQKERSFFFFNLKLYHVGVLQKCDGLQHRICTFQLFNYYLNYSGD